jgi:hypothetical protein
MFRHLISPVSLRLADGAAAAASPDSYTPIYALSYADNYAHNYAYLVKRRTGVFRKSRPAALARPVPTCFVDKEFPGGTPFASAPITDA